MTDKRFTINNDMSLDSKVETYELSCIVDNHNKTFYFIVDSIGNVESFVERLNELNEENQQLHRVIEENEKMIQSIYEELTKLRCIKENLRKIKTQWDWIMGSVDYD